MTPAERAAAYAAAFPQWPASHPRVDGRWLQATWILGNDYRSVSGYYGSYPPGYLKRMVALFPEPGRVLHVFSGSLQASTAICFDRTVSDVVRPTVQGDATALPFLTASFDLCYADPPYTATDAVKYGLPMVNRGKVLKQLYEVVKPGGNLVWMDTILPMFRKDQWRWWGAITLIRSTNHRVRLVSLFERVPTPAPGALLP